MVELRKIVNGECWCGVGGGFVVLGLVFLLVCCLFGTVFVLGVSVPPPEENVWVEVASMRYARCDFGAAVVDGKIYAIGGIEKQGIVGHPNPQRIVIVSSVEVYDPLTNRWAERSSPMPTPRYGFAVACFMGKIYCIGGYTDRLHGDSDVGVTEVYDPATGQWETKTAMASRGAGYACVLDGRIYVMGRYAAPPYDGVLYPTICEVYDPIEDTWSVYDGPGPEMPSNSMVFDGREYVWDGSKLRIYDLGLDSWVDGAGLPRELYGRGVVEVEGLLYALGGCTKTYKDPFNTEIPVRASVRSCFVYTPFGYGRVAPEVCVLSLEENGVYDFRNVTLEFGIKQPVVWVGYSLDGQANVTVEGSSVVLSGLSGGWHSVRVFAEDKYGNVGVSETVSFSVVNAPLSMLFIVVVAVVVLVVVGVCLLLFLRKRRCMKSLPLA